MKGEKKNILVILSYITIYLVWGSTYYFIKLSVQTIPPFYVVGTRFTIGGLLFLTLSFITGKLTPFPRAREILASFMLGSLLLLGGNGLITIAEQEVASYIVALIIATTPIIVAFFNRVLFNIRIKPIKLGGIVIGIVGVGFLLYDGTSLTSSISIHTIMVLVGILLWGFATSLGHRLQTPRDSFVNSAFQMLFVGLVSFILVSLFHKPISEIIPIISLSSIVGVLYLSIIGSLGFSAYTYLIRNEPSIRVVSYALVNPLIATFIGIVLGKESIVSYFVIGLPLILGGLFLMLYGELLLEKIGISSTSVAVSTVENLEKEK